MLKRTLSKKDTEKTPYLVWNAFIDLIAMEDERDLTEIQRHAQRAFRYESEVQNGGHGQYFDNQRLEDYSVVIASLYELGAHAHAAVLEKAVTLFFGKTSRPRGGDPGDTHDIPEQEIIGLDFSYGNIQPDMNHYLAEYLKQHRDEFIEIL